MKFRHIYLHEGSSPTPVATLASCQHKTENIVRFTMARCNNMDQFCKKSGRRISSGRLNRCKRLITMGESFNDRVQYLFSGSCVLFEMEEIRSLIQAVKSEAFFRHGKSYRELAMDRSL